MDASQLVGLGLEYHRAGDYCQAEFAYRQALDEQPQNADVWCLLGMVQRVQGNTAAAQGSLEEALRLRPEFVEARVNLGNVFGGQQQWNEAIKHYRQALAVSPDHVDGLMNLGVALRGLGQIDDALATYRRALAMAPQHAMGLANLADVLLTKGQPEEAAASCRQALQLQPNLPTAHLNLGVALSKLGQTAQGIAHLQRALQLQPGYFEAQLGLGNALLAEKRYSEALAAYRVSAEWRPTASVAHYSLGLAHAELGQLDQAADCYREAIRLQPAATDALVNLGNVAADRQDWDAAAGHYRQALGFHPADAGAMKNLAITLLDQGKLAAAEHAFRDMLEVHPDSAEAHLGLAGCLLIAGDYRRGWPEYEWRWRTPEFGPLPDLPRWRGEPLAGRSLLLVAEQGLGDTLQFVRYARPLKRLGARIVLACPASLHRLLASIPEVDELRTADAADAAPRCDYHLPLLSAPYALVTTELTIPREVPYLAADPQLVKKWKTELGGTAGLKVGIAWQGSRDYRQDRWRSIPLAQFAPLAAVPGVSLIGLQKGFGAEQIGQVEFPILDLAGRLDAEGAFVDTAAVIANLDLVVTSDTAIAHLAGASGAPVWLALQQAPNWRWLVDREDSPWYPTMRLFRQRARGDWGSVLSHIAAELPQVKPR